MFEIDPKIGPMLRIQSIEFFFFLLKLINPTLDC